MINITLLIVHLFIDINIEFVSLQGASKRPVDERILEDSNNEKKSRRGEKPKLSYSDVAKAGHIMMEVRASNLEVQLGQPDYDNIEHQLALAYVNLPAPRPAEMPKIFQMGLSQVGTIMKFTVRITVLTSTLKPQYLSGSGAIELSWKT